MATLQARLEAFVSAVGADMKTTVKRGEGWIDLRKQAGIVGDGVVDDASVMNSVFASAATLGLRVFGYGTFRINSTVTIACDTDLAGATFNYYGSGIAVQVGTTATTFRLHVSLPTLFASNKSALGWGQVVGSVGVKVLNTNSSYITGVRMRNFETGLLVRGEGRGCAYNDITIQHLDNNKIQHDISADATGWSNENHYHINRFSYDSGEGSNVSGTRDIRIQTAPSLPNNNVWWGGSVEGDTPEYHLECAGGENRFMHMRWESPAAGCRVWWRTGQFRNVIDHGYGAHQIIETFETGAGTATIFTGSGTRLRQSAINGVLQIENGGSSNYACITMMGAGAGAAGSDPATAYAAQVGASLWKMKRPTDAFDRVQIDPVNSRLYFGSGSVAPSRYLANLGTTAISMNGGNFNPGTDNTLDLGGTGFRWRDVYVGQHVRLGTLYLRDNAGVFEKSTNGTTWSVVDTTGGVLPDVDFLSDYNTALA